MATDRADLLTIQITNWDRWQARSDRPMPWIKFWKNILNHRVWELSPSEWKVFSYLLLAANEQGSIRLRADFIQTSCRVRAEFVQSSLRHLEEFGVLTVENAATEDKIREEKIRPRTRTPKTPKTPAKNRPQKREKTGPPTASLSATADPSVLLDSWNNNCGPLPKAKAMTPKRAKAARARLKENPDPAFWVDVVQRMAQSPFLRGEIGKGGWRATFDFLLRPDTATKVLEGLYGPAVTAKPSALGTEIFYG